VIDCTVLPSCLVTELVTELIHDACAHTCTQTCTRTHTHTHTHSHAHTTARFTLEQAEEGEQPPPPRAQTQKAHAKATHRRQGLQYRLTRAGPLRVFGAEEEEDDEKNFIVGVSLVGDGTVLLASKVCLGCVWVCGEWGGVGEGTVQMGCAGCGCDEVCTCMDGGDMQAGGCTRLSAWTADVALETGPTHFPLAPLPHSYTHTHTHTTNPPIYDEKTHRAGT
jgi:hypothetical protein